MKWTPQTGDTQAISIEKHDGFIEWCIGVAKTAVERGLSGRAESQQAGAVELSRKRNAA